ncbi:MAG TPA: protein kinase [Candidatus Limnocylindrales bacterium]|nr:protein kinase [Candidatus Limnocylindrales bacterium]
MPETVLFDRYRLLEPAGSGGSAEVWRARDEQTGDEVAVKRLHPVVFADEAGRRRLEREFHALQGLDEPHIVRVRDLQVGEREAALVLDYIDGDSLAQRMAGQTSDAPAVDRDTAVAIVADIAAALAAAHAAGIVHRDVTPGNILLTREGEGRLTDFGIARASSDATAVTATGLLMGTMRYLAPEQLRGGTSTPASDLHGLAAVAYEMLAGRPAYAASSPVELAEAQQAGPAPIDGVPPALDAAVRRGLAVAPEERPTDVLAFAASLADAARDDRTVAIPIGALAAGGVVLGGATAGAATAADAAVGGGPAAAASMVDDVGVAVPSRAAAAHGPLPPAESGPPDSPRLDQADPEPVAAPVAQPVHRSTGRPTRGRGVPAAAAVAFGILVAVGLLAAAGSTSPPFGATADRASQPAAPTARPTARPTPTPAPKDNPGKGEGKGKGNGDKDD